MRTRSENQVSSPKFSVTVAKIATSTVGPSATTENTIISRMCSREPADFRRRSAIIRATRTATSVATIST